MVSGPDDSPFAVNPDSLMGIDEEVAYASHDNRNQQQIRSVQLEDDTDGKEF